jgi:predicted Zn-dependent protease
MALVSVDNFTTILAFVFVESQLGGNAIVISLFRAQCKKRDKFFNRASKKAIPDCLMGFSRNLEKLDSLLLRFCPACELEARRLLRHLFGQPW